MAFDRRWLDARWVLSESASDVRRALVLGLIGILVLGAIAYVLAMIVSPGSLIPG
ncbi:MAG TPA: hypothetical protein VEC15_13005 [Actinomycetota bacterium]|nr:hypothetical protein [Actinomycetota bacterium]